MWSGQDALNQSAARLRARFAALIQARWWIAAWTLSCLATAALYLVFVPSQYVGRVDVVLAARSIANDGPEVVRHFHQINLDSEQAATELQILRSEQLLRPVFNRLTPSETIELTQSRVGVWQAAARFAHRLAPGGADYSERELAYFAFASRVRCLQLGLSYVFAITYHSHDPALAARVANAVAAQYLADRVGRERTRRESLGGGYEASRSEALKQQEEISLAGAAAGVAPAEDLPAASARILGPAVKPLGKSYPKTVPTLALGGFLGLFSGLFLVLVLGAGAAERRRAADHEWASEPEVSTSSG